jgi:hypothetical protein
MRISIATEQALYDLRNFYAFRRLQFGFVVAVSLMMFITWPNNAAGQFPGVGSQAPSGMAIESSGDGISAGAADAGISERDDDAYSSADAVSGQSDDDGNGVGYQSPDRVMSTSMLKIEEHRKQLFVKKLRLEFAAIEFIERKTGLPFSRDDVPRYLDELRSDLKTIAGKEEKGAIVKGEVQSVARDAYHIETQLNHYLDQLLDHVGQPVPIKTFFALMPALPKTSRVASQKLDMLSLKFELADYGEKTLQAMGAKRY